jgi:hypothetical protein
MRTRRGRRISTETASCGCPVHNCARGTAAVAPLLSLSGSTFVDDDARLLTKNSTKRVSAMSAKHEEYLATIASLAFAGLVIFLISVGVLLMLP